MGNWFESTLGRSVTETELNSCGQLVPSGYYARSLQVGMAGVDYLANIESSNRYYVKTKQCLSNWSVPKSHIVRAVSEQLPFPERSQNLVVLPHTLDFCENPHEVLRQVNQILEPEGCLAIVGFNSHSLYGLVKSLKRSPELPWSGQFYSVRRVQDWLSLLGYDLVGANLMGYQLPLQSDKWRSRSEFLEPAGNRWWPGFGGVYVIVGRKKEIMVNPIGRTKTWQHLIPGMARPASASQRAARMGIHLVKE